MRLVAQRVESCKVINKDTNKVIGQIGNGLLVLLGVGEGDSERDVDKLADKLTKLRIISDSKGKMNLSVIDSNQEVLIVSQFTLIADTNAGNRPSFIKAAKPDVAEKLYEYFVEKVKEKGVKVETGEFGAYMIIDSKLDGPVTITLES